MTLDLHHPSPADVDPLGEGLGAHARRQRASERDKSHFFFNDTATTEIYTLSLHDPLPVSSTWTQSCAKSCRRPWRYREPGSACSLSAIRRSRACGSGCRPDSTTSSSGTSRRCLRV